MTIDETYNIHKEINCVFPFFKSKLLCKHNLHNFEIRSEIEAKPITRKVYDKDMEMMRTELIEYQRSVKTYWKCRSCGKKERFDD